MFKSSSLKQRAFLLKLLAWKPPLKLMILFLLLVGLSLLKIASALIYFGPPTYYLPSEPSANNVDRVAMADIDKDGDNDLGLIAYSGASVTGDALFIYKNDGNGNFSAAGGYPTHGPFTGRYGTCTPYYQDHGINLVFADLNNDTYPDIIVPQSYQGSFVFVYMNKGATEPGAFTLDWAYNNGFNPWELTVNDFNGDGWLDLGFANWGNPLVTGWFTVALNKGPADPGGFGTAAFPTYGVGSFNHPTGIASGDFNGDKIIDLVLIDSTAANQLFIFKGLGTLGVGNGTFSNTPDYQIAMPGNLYAIKAVDLDADGDSDLVTTNGNVVILYNDANGVGPAYDFAFHQDTYNDALGVTRTLNVADMDVDGVLDVITGNTPIAGHEFSVFSRKSDGTHTHQFIKEPNNYIPQKGIAISNLNADDIKPDLAYDRGSLAGVMLQEVLILSLDSTKDDDVYREGAVLDIEVKFSEPVDVVGTPSIRLYRLDPPQQADYVSGSGTDTLTFTYTVPAGSIFLYPGVGVAEFKPRDYNALVLDPGESIKDSATKDQNAILTLPVGATTVGSFDYNTDIFVDTLLNVVGQTKFPGIKTSNAPILVSGIIVYDEFEIDWVRRDGTKGVVVDPLSTATYDGLTCTTYTYSADNRVNRLSCNITVTGSGLLVLRATDRAGNSGLSNQNPINNTYTISTVGPSILFSSIAPADAYPKVSNGPITVGVDISDSDGLANINFSSAPGTVTYNPPTCNVDPATLPTSPATTSVHCDVVITAATVQDLTVSATDGLGNPNSATAAGFMIETDSPTIVINPLNPATPSKNQHVTITVTDNYAVDYADVSHVEAVGMTVDHWSCAQGVDEKTVDCSVDITGTNNLSKSLTITASDRATNPNSGASAYTIDITPPTITFFPPASKYSLTPLTVVIVVDDNVSISPAGVVKGGGVGHMLVGSCTQTVNPTQVTCSYIVDSSLPPNQWFSVSATDSAGNNTVNTDDGYLVSGSLPYVTLTAPDPINGRFTVTAHFNQVVDGFSEGEIKVDNGSEVVGSFVNVLNSNQDYTFNIDPNIGTVTVTVPDGVALGTVGGVGYPTLGDQLVRIQGGPAGALLVSVLSCAATAPDTIDWNFTDPNSAPNNEDGVKLYDGLATLINTYPTPNLTQIAESPLSTNTLYTRYVTAYNLGGESGPSNQMSCCTLANKPNPLNTPTPVVGANPASFNLQLDPTDGNPPATKYAILETIKGKYLHTDGLFYVAAEWHTYAEWGGASGINMPIEAGVVSYTFVVQAQNCDTVPILTAPSDPTTLNLPTLTVSKAVRIDLVKGLDSGFVLSALAGTGADIGPVASNYAIRGMSWLLNIALVILVIFFGISIYKTIKYLRNEYGLAIFLAVANSLVFKKPQHVFESYAVKTKNGSYKKNSFAKHKDLQEASKQTLRGICFVLGLKALVVLALAFGLMIFNHFGSAALPTDYVNDGTDLNLSQKLSYMVVVSNTGAEIASDVKITDTLHSALNYVAGTAFIYDINQAQIGTGTILGNVLTFNIGDMNPGEEVYVTFKTAPNNATTVTNTAAISGSNFATITTNQTSNNVNPTGGEDVPVCGDGSITGTEQCEADTDCTTGQECNACMCEAVAPVCGDTLVTGSEACDASAGPTLDNCPDNTYCNATCTDCLSICGNGILDTGAGEACDSSVPGGSGNTCSEHYACNSVCECQIMPFCGDTAVNDGEVCDASATSSGCTDLGSICNASCSSCEQACGNGTLDTGEECDDGNTNNNDACLNTCKNAACGDGVVESGVEECDDSNTDSGDGCSSTCKNEYCGDGIAQPGLGEQCDDGGTASGDGCSASCKNEICGDGIVQSGLGEQCDDGNSSNTDACVSCKNAICGDGFARAGVEDCDDGNSNNNDACLNTCENAVCGDNVIRTGVEQCDDGNTVNGDGCSAICEFPGSCNDKCSISCNGGWTCSGGFCRNSACVTESDCICAGCGNGKVDAGEQCDDSNTINTDACVNCKNATCGDGFIEAGVEECDDANTIDTDACVSCKNAFCGDGVTEAGVEACDDGNGSNYDSCRLDCTLPVCGDGYINPGEECDDGNNASTDGCSAACKTEYCGDGILQQPREECEDNNTENNDGCSFSCQIEHCGDGVTQTKEECDDGGTVDGDGCSATCELEPVCGDGMLEGTEQCDGNDNPVPAAFCSGTCQIIAGCGNGIVEATNEQCDDSNTVPGDGCSAACQTEIAGPVCPNGVLEIGEGCDDGNAVNGDGCSDQCQIEPGCGNNILESGEQCEDGNIVSNDGCSADCQVERCGDNIKQTAEECDNDTDIYCDGTCHIILQGCGNTIVETAIGEQCESTSDCSGLESCVGCVCENSSQIICGDGNLDLPETCEVSLDPAKPNLNNTCSANEECNFTTCQCQPVNQPVCSNGIIEAPEICDGQGCPSGSTCVNCSLCQDTTGINFQCGNSYIEPGEDCDNSSCGRDRTKECIDCKCVPTVPPECGDGKIDTASGEQCDGNSCGNGLLCISCQCQAEESVKPVCGNSRVEDGEACDNSACLLGNECTDCQCVPAVLPVCGNGLIEQGEQCDRNACEGGLGCLNCQCQQIYPAQPAVCGNGRIEQGEQCDKTGCGKNEQCSSKCQCQPVEFQAAPEREIPIIGPIIAKIAQTEPIKTINEKVLDNPQVEQVSQNVVTPVLLTLAVVNTVPMAVAITSNLLLYLHLLFLEPLLWFFRKKRGKAGSVYNSLTKMPVDLALVKLFRKKDNQLAQTAVTNRQGNYWMTVAEPGDYYLSVSKPHYIYPTKYLGGETQDTKFVDLYHGEVLTINEKGVPVVANIPLDPEEKAAAPLKEVAKTSAFLGLRTFVAYSGTVLALAVVLIIPTVVTALALAAHLILLGIFTRLTTPPKPKNWGIVYDDKTKKPLAKTVVRIFDTRFNKLLDSKVTDSKGRYGFGVGSNNYRVSAGKEGYQGTGARDVDLVNNKEATNINIGLQKK